MASNVVTERTVKRYFYRGKGYATKLRAYKAMAKDALILEVLGPLAEYHDNYTGASSTYREKLDKDVFAGKMRDFGFECDTAPDYYDGVPRACCPESFGFCGKKYKAWISAKAHGLLKADWIAEVDAKVKAEMDALP